VVTILFWNIHKRKEALDHLACFGRNGPIDIYLLSECPASLEPALGPLKALESGNYRVVDDFAKVKAITRLGADVFSFQVSGNRGRLAVWSISGSQFTPHEVLVAGVQLPSKFGGLSPADQADAARRVVENLRDFEDDRGHRNTVICGDFNMNPYDHGMTIVTGFHGLMTRSLAMRGDRVHEERSYRRLYNPMWGLYGDSTPGAAGSYYWRRSEALHNPHWMMHDQVLVRKGLIERLARVEILTCDGFHKLVDARGTPDHKRFSDHLPIRFSLDL
jgi:hypothetical protein